MIWGGNPICFSLDKTPSIADVGWRPMFSLARMIRADRKTPSGEPIIGFDFVFADGGLDGVPGLSGGFGDSMFQK